jgi:twitching motility protein PilT
MARLHELLEQTKQASASDLHLATGMEPRVRRLGALEPLPGWPVFDAPALAALLREVVSDAQWREYESTGDLDFAIGLTGIARFRANYLRQEHGPSAVFRTIPETIASAEQLGLPDAVARLADLTSGLVLVTGPTGSGKSTTLAAIVDRINRTTARHVVTIEDPVEFLHRPIRSVFSQREVGTDTDSFASALRAAIRQDADVILVGELRDLETIALALRAAEMGTLVFGTLHTNSAAKTIDRLVDVFPAEEQAQVRISLSESLAAIVAQQLLPRADGSGRVAALELLLRTSALPGIVREGNLPMLQTVIQGGRALGMQRMDDALAALVEAGTVTARAAYLKALDKSRFEPLLREV